MRNLERELGTVLRKTATRIASAQASPRPTGSRRPPTRTPSKASAEDNGKVAADAEKKPAKKTKAAKAAKQAPVKIDLEAVRDALGRQKFFQESAARTATPGVATGLAVTGAGGDVLFVEATAMKAGGATATASCSPASWAT